jgi:hypothetical protein
MAVGIVDMAVGIVVVNMAVGIVIVNVAVGIVIVNVAVGIVDVAVGIVDMVVVGRERCGMVEPRATGFGSRRPWTARCP